MLSGTRQFEVLQRSGQVRAHPLLLARYAANELGRVRWGLATSIVWAWVLTIPASAIVAWLTFELIRLFVRNA